MNDTILLSGQVKRECSMNLAAGGRGRGDGNDWLPAAKSQYIRAKRGKEKKGKRKRKRIERIILCIREVLVPQSYTISSPQPSLHAQGIDPCGSTKHPFRTSALAELSSV